MLKAIIPQKRFNYIFYPLSILFLFFLITFYSFSKIRRVDSIPIGVESIILMIFIIYYFYFEITNITTQNIYEKHSFWIVLGILIYLSFTFFFNILANSLDSKIIDKYFHFSYIGDIMRNIFFGISIIYLAKESKKETKESAKKVPYLDMI